MVLTTREEQEQRATDNVEEEKIRAADAKAQRIADNMEDYWKHQASGAEGGW
jgi:hypothetical protein